MSQQSLDQIHRLDLGRELVLHRRQNTWTTQTSRTYRAVLRTSNPLSGLSGSVTGRSLRLIGSRHSFPRSRRRLGIFAEPPSTSYQGTVLSFTRSLSRLRPTTAIPGPVASLRLAGGAAANAVDRVQLSDPQVGCSLVRGRSLLCGLPIPFIGLEGQRVSAEVEAVMPLDAILVLERTGN